jgi:hypothetical protein
MLQEHEYTLDYPAGGDSAVLRGVLRLASSAAYDTVFAPLRTRLEQGGALTLDLAEVPFMNSSGIRSLATLVLLAKAKNANLRIIAKDSVPWQKKTMASLRGINPALVVEMK